MLSTPVNRLDYLDATRAFALILGVFFHASLSFMPMYIGWAVMDINTSQIVPALVLVSHSFRMELFFLLAGFFGHMACHKQGVRQFIKSRLLRIALPFIVCWFVLRAMLVSGWIMGAESIRGEADILGALIDGIGSLQELPVGLFVGTHLWFLYYLILISFSWLLIRYCFSRMNVSLKIFDQALENVIQWFGRSTSAIILLSAPTAICLWFMTNWGVDTPDKSLIPNIPVLVLYGGFFLSGWLMYRRPEVIEQLSKISWFKIGLCVLAIALSIILSSYEMKSSTSHYSLIKIAYVMSYSIMMWSLVGLTLGMCKRLFSTPSAIVRYVADSSYWLYLIHLPIVIWLQVAFAELPLHWLLKLVSISVITIGLALLIYDVLVRSTFLGAVLNGRRKPRAIFFPNR